MISKFAVATAGALFALSTGIALADWDWAPDREHAFYDRFMDEHFAGPPGGFNVEVGGVVPEGVELYEAPTDFVYAPVRVYRYIPYQSRIYVIEPRSRRVVHIIER